MKRALGICAAFHLSLSGACVTKVELARSAPDELLVMGTVADGVLERFASEPAGAADDSQLGWTYPADGTELPANLTSMRFAWKFDAKMEPTKPEPAPMPMKAKGDPQPPDATYFELCLAAGPRDLCIYTDASDVKLDAAHWTQLLGARSDSTITIRLRALASKEDRLFTTEQRRLVVAAPVSSGAVYYVDQQSARVRRATVSTESATETQLASPTASSVAISRDGKHMLFAPAPDTLQLVSLPDLAILWSVPAPLAGPQNASMAFDPTARRIAYARAGTLALLDADDGTVLSSTAAPEGVRTSHPDWSPDGRSLAVTLWPADAMPDEDALEGSSVARLPVALDGTLGTPELLVGSSKRDDTLAFPVFSRDGEWLAYLQFKGKLRDAKEGALWLVPSSGGEPILRSGAGMMKPKDQALTLLPSAPSWLPSEDPELAWLSFSAQGSLAMRTAQLWLIPLHRATPSAGVEVDARALWLPFQDEASANLWPAFAPD